MHKGHHAKLINGDEEDYLSRRARRLVRVARGAGRRIKRNFWKRMRARARLENRK